MDNQDATLDHIMSLGLEPAERFKSLITAWATEYFATPLCERIQELEQDLCAFKLRLDEVELAREKARQATFERTLTWLNEERRLAKA
jgi:hypothetical protein